MNSKHISQLGARLPLGNLTAYCATMATAQGPPAARVWILRYGEDSLFLKDQVGGSRKFLRCHGHRARLAVTRWKS